MTSEDLSPTEATGGASDEAAEPELPPFKIEGARSSRSRCRTCKRKIDKGLLRLGVLLEGPYGTGYVWHHLACAAKRRFEQVEEAYGLEAWEEKPADLPPLDELRQLQEKAAEQRKKRKEIPVVEVAPSGRARCKHCEELIEKGNLRVVLARGVEFYGQVRAAPINVHPECVVQELGQEDCMTEIEGFEELLRANSHELEPGRVEEALARIGDLE